MTETEGDKTRPSDLLHRCVNEIEAAGTDLSAYNTSENANDVAALMSALGYETYNIHGISYGTRLTLEVLRSHPDAVRAAIIDGVAPLQVPLYETLAVPGSEVIELTLQQCAADAACNAAFPDFRAVLRDTLDRAAAGELFDADGDPITVELVLTPFLARNGTYAAPSTLTPFIPSMIHEMADPDSPSPLLDHVMQTDGQPQLAAPLDRAREGLLDTEAAALDDAVRMAEGLVQADVDFDLAIDTLRRRLHETDVPLARIFDDEMVRSATELLEDADRRRDALLAYARLREGPPDADALRAYVQATFPRDRHSRLLGLIDAMSTAELAAVFSTLSRQVSQTLEPAGGNLHLWIYACQESIPFNSYAGFRETTDALPWPEVGTLYDDLAQEFFAACEAFAPAPRPGFHDPVASAVPVLSVGSTWDTQTAPGWPALASETLSNAQTFLIGEAGHGAIAYQPCVADLVLAFLTDPLRTLPDTCERSTVPRFHIP